MAPRMPLTSAYSIMKSRSRWCRWAQVTPKGRVRLSRRHFTDLFVRHGDGCHLLDSRLLANEIPQELHQLLLANSTYRFFLCHGQAFLSYTRVLLADFNDCSRFISHKFPAWSFVSQWDCGWWLVALQVWLSANANTTKRLGWWHAAKGLYGLICKKYVNRVSRCRFPTLLRNEPLSNKLCCCFSCCLTLKLNIHRGSCFRC